MKTVRYYTDEEIKTLIQKSVESEDKKIKAVKFAIFKSDGARVGWGEEAKVKVVCEVEIEEA